MPFKLPEHPSDPNGIRESDFVPLADVAPEMSAALIETYLHRWVRLAELSPEPDSDAALTVELKVAYFDIPGVDTELRLRSWYTGSTYWQNDWDNTLESALAWIEDVAELQAANALGDRQHGPRLWEGNPAYKRRQ